LLHINFADVIKASCTWLNILLMMTAEKLIELIRQKGAMEYAGEGVSQLQHAWQCGDLAERAGASKSLQLASWLHDIGHMLTDLPGTPTLQGIDDRHEILGARVLHDTWGDEVSEPVRLHVQAKRFMVTTLPGYSAKLSEDSVRSLALQGGLMDSQECDAFNANPFADSAVRLRAWDDAAKQNGVPALSEEAMLLALGALMERVPVAKAKV
jgi:phosphonate degradation associated HDIG domain protein